MAHGLCPWTLEELFLILILELYVIRSESESRDWPDQNTDDQASIFCQRLRLRPDSPFCNLIVVVMQFAA